MVMLRKSVGQKVKVHMLLELGNRERDISSSGRAAAVPSAKPRHPQLPPSTSSETISPSSFPTPVLQKTWRPCNITYNAHRRYHRGYSASSSDFHRHQSQRLLLLNPRSKLLKIHPPTAIRMPPPAYSASFPRLQKYPQRRPTLSKPGRIRGQANGILQSTPFGDKPNSSKMPKSTTSSRSCR